MNNDKWNYAYISVLGISCVINILGCINIVSDGQLKINIMAVVFVNTIMLLKQKKIKVKLKFFLL